MLVVPRLRARGTFDGQTMDRPWTHAEHSSLCRSGVWFRLKGDTGVPVHPSHRSARFRLLLDTGPWVSRQRNTWLTPSGKRCPTVTTTAHITPRLAYMVQTPPTRVLTVQATPAGADPVFAGGDPKQVQQWAADFLTGFGLSHREDGFWTRGTPVRRVLLGGLAPPAKYTLKVTQTDAGVELSLASVMSGWSGSFIGVARERSQRREFIRQLRQYITLTQPVIDVESAAPH